MPPPAAPRRASRLLALLLLPPAVVAGKGSSADATKTFQFKDDVFLGFDRLSTAIGPESAGVLLDALNGEFVAEFEDAWTEEIERTLQGGACRVEKMQGVKFSLCRWSSDKYDADELPTPGQCYDYQDRDQHHFVQRLYYRIDKLVITCPDHFSYRDLDKVAYTEAAFSGSTFLDILQQYGTSCDSAAPTCLFSDAAAVDAVDHYETCSAELYITRFVDVNVYLKCLKVPYGKKVANKLIKALDEYFETTVAPVLEAGIHAQCPESFVYGFASPYDSDRRYCAHGAYYSGGQLRDQVRDEDGVLVTRFTYGFDAIWFKPRDCRGEVLPDVEDIINGVFADGDFLRFLQDKYSNLDFIRDCGFCDVIDAGSVTFPPTEEPTLQPTEGPACDLDTDAGCDDGQVCRLSCVWGTSDPQCFDDDAERDCTDKYGPGWVCRDTNGDGSLDSADHSDGCEYRAPTAAPSDRPTAFPTGFPTPQPTDLPTKFPTVSPTTSPTRFPSLSPTPRPSDAPTLRPVTAAPTERAATPFPTDHPVTVTPTGAPTDEPTDKPTDEPTGVPTTSTPTRDPTLVPSPRPTDQPTSGDTQTVGRGDTLVPTFLLTRPAATHTPTFLTPGPTCPMCIVYPDDTKEDECPIVTTGTCGDGNRGDGICPFAGHCCSKWGYCGTTNAYCNDDSVAPSPAGVDGAPQSPTYSVDAGQCANGVLGDEFCAEDSLCCSEWGYCGSGENYCFSTKWDDTGPEEEYGTCGGGGTGDGVCMPGLCCSKYGFCGEGDLYCTGYNQCPAAPEEPSCYETAQIIINGGQYNPLPDNLKPEVGIYRCGFSEVDARSNCKKPCTHHVQCEEDGEECWGVQLNYCNTFRNLGHPVCTDLDLADDDWRCGLDEVSARGHCGAKCTVDDECDNGELCFSTLLNLCECHAQTEPEKTERTMFSAKALISPYFVDSENAVEGRPRSASAKLEFSVATSLLLVFASLNVLMM